MACVCSRRGKWALDFKDQHGIRRIIQTEWSSNSAKDKREAEKLLRSYLTEVDSDRFQSKSEQRNFEQLTEDYLGHVKLHVREVTRTDYLSIINTHLKVYIAKMKLRAITRLEVEKYLAWVHAQPTPSGKQRSVRTTNKSLTLLSMMLKFGVGHRWLDSNPCDHVRKLKASHSARRRALDGNILTAAACERLYEHADGQRDRLLFRFAVETGLRQGELFGLQWRDIDWASSCIHVGQSVRKGKIGDIKTASSLRSIPIRPELLQQLKVWKLACPTAKPKPTDDLPLPELVFPNSVGRFECPHDLLRRNFHPALRRAGLRQIRFHDLRHTCASLLLAAGVGIKNVQAQLGHASAQVTLDVYGHLMPDTASPGADAMQGIFGCNNAEAGKHQRVSARV